MLDSSQTRERVGGTPMTMTMIPSSVFSWTHYDWSKNCQLVNHLVRQFPMKAQPSRFLETNRFIWNFTNPGGCGDYLEGKKKSPKKNKIKKPAALIKRELGTRAMLRVYIRPVCHSISRILVILSKSDTISAQVTVVFSSQETVKCHSP